MLLYRASGCCRILRREGGGEKKPRKEHGAKTEPSRYDNRAQFAGLDAEIRVKGMHDTVDRYAQWGRRGVCRAGLVPEVGT
jgi:hypothetical protein